MNITFPILFFAAFCIVTQRCCIEEMITAHNLISVHDLQFEKTLFVKSVGRNILRGGCGEFSTLKDSNAQVRLWTTSAGAEVEDDAEEIRRTGIAHGYSWLCCSTESLNSILAPANRTIESQRAPRSFQDSGHGARAPAQSF